MNNNNYGFVFNDISIINKREEYWLKYYNVANNPLFYNKTNKPFGPKTHSKDTRKILKDKLTGQKREGDALENIRKGHKKRILNINGEKISKAKTGHECYKNHERGEKISQSNTGKKQSEQTCKKRSESLKGKSTRPKKQIKESYGFASKPTGYSQKTNTVESDPFIARMQKLAGL
jgi:hypothetical protein